MPFLTDLDSRAEVKGSRDPLGLVPIWSQFGREVVGNLTTVTDTVRGFTTLLLGLYFAERVQEIERDDAPSTLDLFLKFEQMAGYARMRHNNDDAVRGVRRINTELSDRRRVTISAAPANQILSNQKVYGLWGLFSTAARSSELLLPREQRLTPVAREFVEKNYIPQLPNGASKNGRVVIEVLRRQSFLFDVDSELGVAIGKIHGRLKSDERVFYRDHLAWGGIGDSTFGKQRQLAEILQAMDADEFGFPEFEKVQSRVTKLHLDGLSDSLARIEALEHLLMPARVVFGYLLTKNSQTVSSVAQNIAKEWKRHPAVDVPAVQALRDRLTSAAGSSEAANRWLRIAELIDLQDYQSLIEALVGMNTLVMQSRNGSAAWLSIESARLHVRMADETEELLPARDVENLWRSTYFINSLWNVAREVA